MSSRSHSSLTSSPSMHVNTVNLSKENLTQMMAEYEEMEEKRKADEAEASVKGEEWKKVFREAKEKAEKSDSKI